jgi:uncharacterized protein DUF4124
MMIARNLSIAIFVTLTASVALPLAHADIYTWTDARGVTNVSNLPPPDGAKVSHLVHETPPPAPAVSDAAREAARQAEVRALSERVRELEAAASVPSVPPDLMYAARVPVPPPQPPAIQYNVTVLPQQPQYAEPPPQPTYGCDPSWIGCLPWLGTYFYPAPVAVVHRSPNVHRFPPFRADHPNHGPSHHVTSNQPIARMPGGMHKS